MNDEVATPRGMTKEHIFDSYWNRVSKKAKDKITGQDLVVSISSGELNLDDFIEKVLYVLIRFYEDEKEKAEIDYLWSNITFNWRPIDNPGSFDYFEPFFSLVNIHNFLLQDYGEDKLEQLKADYKAANLPPDFEIFKKLFDTQFYIHLSNLHAIFGDSEMYLLAISFGLAIFEYEGREITPEMRDKYTGIDYTTTLNYDGESFLNESIKPLQENSSIYLKGLLDAGFDAYKEKFDFLGEDVNVDILNTLTSDQILQILELEELRKIMANEHISLLETHKADNAAADAAANAAAEGDFVFGGGFNKRRKTKKRKTNKRKIIRQQINKRKSNRRKSNRRKSNKRKRIKKRTNKRNTNKRIN